MRLSLMFTLGALALLPAISCKRSIPDSHADSSLLVSATSHPRLEKRIETLLRSFCQDDSAKSCLYEIFVDKQSPEVAVLVLKRTHQRFNRTQRFPPLFFVEIDGHRFSVYSGLEQYIEGSLDLQDSTKPLRTDTCPWKAATYIDSAGSITKFADIGYPFVPVRLGSQITLTRGWPEQIRDTVESTRSHR
jgi:hypothetical protein